VNEAVNKCWLCDRGRLSYHALNDDRLLHPLVKADGGAIEVSWEEALKKAASSLAGAKDKLVAVVSASLSQEEGRAALMLFRDKLAAKMLLHVGEPGPEDGLLRRADQNANTRGLMELGLADKLGAELPAEAVMVLLEGVAGHKLPAGVPAPAVAVSPSRSEAAMSAAVALPCASYAETAGTFVNFEGRAQSFAPALAPAGEALPLAEVLGRLAAALG
jgi:NADH-quinone oxidoreductase subunit G